MGASMNTDSDWPFSFVRLSDRTNFLLCALYDFRHRVAALRYAVLSGSYVPTSASSYGTLDYNPVERAKFAVRHSHLDRSTSEWVDRHFPQWRNDRARRVWHGDGWQAWQRGEAVWLEDPTGNKVMTWSDGVRVVGRRVVDRWELASFLNWFVGGFIAGRDSAQRAGVLTLAAHGLAKQEA